MGTLEVLLVLFLHYKALHCCIPAPPRPGGSGSQPTTAQPTEVIITTTVQGEQNETEQETASTTFAVEHEDSHYTCKFEFSFTVNKGFHNLPGSNSDCKKANKASTSVRFLGAHVFEVVSKDSVDLTCSMAAVFISNNGGIQLVDQAVIESIKCAMKRDTCVTKDGPQFVSKCSVPYIYDGRMYQACTDWPNEKAVTKDSMLWCATKTDNNLVMEEGQWGWCSSACGYCGGKDIVKNSIENSTENSVQTSCKTQEGNTCVFPFLEGTQRHEKCASWKSAYKWCATAVNPDLTYKTWEKCDMTTCEPDIDSLCKTISGPSTGQPCVFPFKEDEATHSSCILWKGKQWCATSVNGDGTYKAWGYCDEMNCPLGRARAGLTRSVAKCGYDCLINLKKKMVSNPPKPFEKLLAPTPVYWKEQLTNFSYNFVSDTAFQFVSGQNGIFLDCSIGSFSNFPNENRIHAKCSSDGIFTVTGGLSFKIWENIDNTQFGCMPCPSGYSQILGILVQDTGNTIGINQGISSFYECVDLCADEDGCRVFEYSPEKQMCALYLTLELSSDIDQGNIICQNAVEETKITRWFWYPTVYRYRYTLMAKHCDRNSFHFVFNNELLIPMLVHVQIWEIPKKKKLGRNNPWFHTAGFFAEEGLGDKHDGAINLHHLNNLQTLNTRYSDIADKAYQRGHLASSNIIRTYFPIPKFDQQMALVVPTTTNFEDITVGAFPRIEKVWYERGQKFMENKEQDNKIFLTFGIVPSKTEMKRMQKNSKKGTGVYVPEKIFSSMIVKNKKGQTIFKEQYEFENAVEQEKVKDAKLVTSSMMEELVQEWKKKGMDVPIPPELLETIRLLEA